MSDTCMPGAQPPHGQPEPLADVLARLQGRKHRADAKASDEHQGRGDALARQLATAQRTSWAPLMTADRALMLFLVALATSGCTVHGRRRQRGGGGKKIPPPPQRKAARVFKLLEQQSQLGVRPR